MSSPNISPSTPRVVRAVASSSTLANREPEVAESANLPPLEERDLGTASILSPILARSPLPQTQPLSPEQPQYAEILTPLKLRRRARNRHLQQANDAVAQDVPVAGPSKFGYYTPEGDLYRGARDDPSAHLRRIPTVPDDDALSVSSMTSTSSSWSWGSGNLERGRKATLAAIGRFGEKLGVRRSRSSDSGDETASEVSGPRRWTRRLSRSRTSDSAATDRPKRQHVPRRREFTLLLPPTISTAIGQTTVDDRLMTTPALPKVLEKIRVLRANSGFFANSPAIEVPKRGGSGQARHRPRLRHGATSFANPPLPRIQALRGKPAEVPRPKSVSDLMGMSNPYGSSSSLSSLRAETPTPTPNPSPPASPKVEEKKGCWWLDVSCPGWEDLRDIGELLGLHPLSLEDVLQQDPREKLDTFDRLGYYFVAVRALDEGYFKYTPGSATSLVGPGQAVEKVTFTVNGSPELKPDYEEKKKEGRRRGWGMGRAAGKQSEKEGEKVEIVEDNPGKEGLEGVGVGAVNLYLAVFADGIVSFHFEDISKHTKRVVDRILTDVAEAPGSDWIAHGLLDSIVDAFFPLVRYVDSEVDTLDSLTVDPTVDPKATPTLKPTDCGMTKGTESIELSEKLFIEESDSDKTAVWRKPLIMPRLSLLQHMKGLITDLTSRIPSLPHHLIYLKLFFLPITSAVTRRHEHEDDAVFDRHTMLKRITDMRKLVTGLSRLLGTKHQVIAKMRKRAMEGDNGAVEAYIGDVEDHILLLQTSLYHYEYILSHCHPAYLSQLSLTFTLVKRGISQSILALSTVTISVLPMQFVTGLFSMNARVPHNGLWESDTRKEPDGSRSPFNFFAGIVVALFLVMCGLVSMIRYWRWQARVKHEGKRGNNLPPFWEGYWGWR